jgi:hypothetical protein
MILVIKSVEVLTSEDTHRKEETIEEQRAAILIIN